MSRLPTNLHWYELAFPADLDSDVTLDFARSLSTRARHGFWSQVRPVVVEVERSGGRYVWRLGLDERDASLIVRRLRALVPAMRIDRTERNVPDLDIGTELRLRSARRVMNTDIAGQAAAALLLSLSGIGHDESVVVQWIIGPWLARSPVPSSWDQAEPGWPWRLLDDTPDLDTEATQAFRLKQREHVFGVVGRIAVRAASTSRRQQLMQRVFGSLQLVREPGVGFIRRLVPRSTVPKRLVECRVPVIEWPCTLNAAELAGVVAWPLGGPRLDGADYVAGRPLPADDATAVSPELLSALASTRLGDRRRPIADTTFPGQPKVMVLRPSDALQHLHVLGPTGSGKSHLLANLALADIAAGRSAVVIEPKGDLVTAILDRVPEHRRHDVIVMDASDLSAPVGLNPLAAARGGRRELVVDQMLSTLHGLWADSWGPRTHDILHVGLLTLAGQPGASLAALPQLFTDDTFRRRMVAEALRRDPWALTSFWAWFDQLSAESRAQVLAPVMNKLRTFLLRPTLRAILGQAEPRFELRDVFTERRVLLVNLAKGSIGPEASSLLGSTLVAQLWQITLERARLDPERRHPVMVSIDEFQDYLHLPTDVADVLAQARGLGVGLTLAHQHLGQLTTDVREAVLANARSRVVFRLPFRDARVIAEGHPELTPDDVASLDRYEVYAALMGNGTLHSFASGRTRDLPPSLGSSGSIRLASRRRWAVPAAETDERLRSMFGSATSGPFDDDEFGTRRRAS
jgi:hypothetical protein